MIRLGVSRSMVAGRVVAGLLLVLSMAVPTFGQRSSTFHLFPHVADGGVASGTAYRTLFVVVSLNQTSTCSLNLHGVDADRVPTTTFEEQGIGFLFTEGTAAELQTGYAILDCTDRVLAYATLQQWHPGSGDSDILSIFRGISSMATLVGPDPGSLIDVSGISSTDCGCRLAIAVANDAIFPQSYRIEWTGGETHRTIAAKSSDSFFVDEVLTVPPEGGPVGLRIVDADGGFFSSDRLYVTALQFVGNRFSEVRPLILR